MPNCSAVESPTFQPARRIITAITLAENAQVTTSFDHDYVTGQIVRILVPDEYGMPQINKLTGEITVNGTDTFTIDIDTRLFQPFAVPGAPSFHLNTCPQVIPVGENSSSFASAVENVLPY